MRGRTPVRNLRFESHDVEEILIAPGSRRRPIPPKRRWGRTIFKLFLLLCFACAVFGAAMLLLPRKPRSVAPRLLIPAAPAYFVDYPEPTSESQLVHEIQRGETFSGMLAGFGFGDLGDRALASITTTADRELLEEKLKPGTTVKISVDGQSSPQEIVIPLPSNEEIVLERIEEGRYETIRRKLPAPVKERVAVGVIKTSFAAAASQAGMQYDVIDELVDLFSDRVVFHKDFRVGDRFTVIYRDSSQKVAGAGKDSILAAALIVKDQMLIAARYVGTDGKSRYFDDKGKLLGDAFLRYPLKFSRISSYFAYSRFHPVLGIKRPHNGVDFAAPVGTPVRTVARGKVLFAGPNGASGITVKIEHTDRYSTAYLHLSKVAEGVKKGAVVERGQVIGAVGQTGLATGPHLHFSFYDKGKYIDPLKMQLPTDDGSDGATAIDRDYLARQLFTLRYYQTWDLNSSNLGESESGRPASKSAS